MVRFRLTAAICVMAIVASLLGGCMNEKAIEPHSEDINFLAKFFDAEEKNVSRSKAMQINPQMTLKDVIALLGAPHHDSGSAHHPLLYSWDLKDGGSLNITFIGNDFDGLWTKLHNNEFVLPDEIIEPETTKKCNVVVGALKRCLTENELSVLKDWALQTKAIYAAIETPEKEKNVLFDLAT